MIEMDTDRISPITKKLDEVIYKSSIINMRDHYFQYTYKNKKWLLLSDYYFGKDKLNKVITFTALPFIGDIIKLQQMIKSVAPKDIKHTRNVSD